MKDSVSRCPIEEVMRVISGRWPTLLPYYLKDGTKRFSDLKRDNPTVSHRMLALELRKLQDAGIVRRTAHDGYPLRVDYDLTAAGLKLVPLIDALVLLSQKKRLIQKVAGEVLSESVTG